MKKIIYYSACVLTMLVSLTACDDFLEAENKTSGGNTADSYFRTEEGLKSFRANAFYSLKTIVTVSSEIFEDGTDLYQPSRGKTPSAFQQYSLTPETGAVKNFYVACSQLINNSNGLLYYGGDTYKAEAIFLRALGYYFLTQHFGAVPYSTEYINNANREYPRIDLKTIYDHLIEDLEALTSDTSIPEITHDGTVNLRAIKGLLAKICLAAGWDLETTLTNAVEGSYTQASHAYFTKAAQWAEEAIAGIAITQDFETKWAPSNENNNPETFFAVQYDRDSYPGDVASGGHGLQNDFGSYYGVVSENGLKGSSSVKVPSLKSLYLFEPTDERYAATYMTTFYNYKDTWGTTGYYAYYNNVPGRSTLPIALYYAPYYTTQADFMAYLAANQARFVKGENNNTVYAYLMANPVIKCTFNDDGSVKAKETIPYNTASLAAQLNFTPAVKKWDDPNTIQEDGNTKNCYRDIVVIHASELCLVAAEAYFMSDQENKAFDKINVIRSRANAPTLTSIAAYRPEYTTSSSFNVTMIDLILDERARELYAEYQRWMDLRRTRQLVRYNIEFNDLIPNVEAMSNTAGEIKWYRPIPAEEMSSNTALSEEDQNLGY